MQQVHRESVALPRVPPLLQSSLEPILGLFPSQEGASYVTLDT